MLVHQRVTMVSDILYQSQLQYPSQVSQTWHLKIPDFGAVRPARRPAPRFITGG